MTKTKLYNIFILFLLVIFILLSCRAHMKHQIKNMASTENNTESGLYAGLVNDLPNEVSVVKEEVSKSKSSIDTKTLMSIEPDTEIEVWRDGYINAKVNVRTAPSTEANIFEEYSFNSAIKYTDYDTKWAKIIYYNKNTNEQTFAYIHKNFISNEPFTKATGNPSDMINTGTYLIKATAYHDRKSSTGVKLKANHSIAGAFEWIGLYCELRTVDGEYIGTYKFEDVGYGRNLGYGRTRFQKSHKGKGYGTIEKGLSVDIYMNSEKECNKWGRRDVYITIFTEDELD